MLSSPISHEDITKIHERMVREVFLEIELSITRGEAELSEYDIQAFVFLAFRRAFGNTGWNAAREKEGKFDVVVYDEKTTPRLFYEIKTYLKSSERIQEKDFCNDIWKLAGKKAGSECTRVFFFAALRKAKTRDLSQKNLVETLLGTRSRKWHVFQSSKNGVARNVSLRPGRADNRGQIEVRTWEVMKSE